LKIKKTEIAQIEPQPSNTLSWNVKANVNYLNAKGGVYHASSLPSKKKQISVKNWELAYFEPFEGGRSKYWEGKGVMRKCGTVNDFSMFHDCSADTTALRKVIGNLGEHSKMKVQLNFHFLDQWEGEQAYVKVGNRVIWARSYKWCENIFAKTCMAKGIDVCGNSYPDLVGQLVSFTLEHSDPQIVLEIGSSLQTGSCKANWGFDNLMIFTK
jgi:hypothetical protein